MEKKLPKGARIIIKKYNSGIIGVDDLVKETNYKKLTVLYYLYKFVWGKTFTEEYNGHKISPMTKEIMNELEAGTPQGQIAKKYGVSRQWVSCVKHYDYYYKGRRK